MTEHTPGGLYCTVALLVVRTSGLICQQCCPLLYLVPLQVQGLRAAYEDIIRLPAAGPPAVLYARVESFVQLEAVLPSGPEAVGPTCIWPLVESWQLEELSYRVVSTVRCAMAHAAGSKSGSMGACGTVAEAMQHQIGVVRAQSAEELGGWF